MKETTTAPSLAHRAQLAAQQMQTKIIDEANAIWRSHIGDGARGGLRLENPRVDFLSQSDDGNIFWAVEGTFESQRFRIEYDGGNGPPMGGNCEVFTMNRRGKWARFYDLASLGRILGGGELNG